MSEATAQFGETLQSVRQDLGLSLQDVAHRTRIPLATLRALEEDNYSHFPSRAYAKSFLAQYTEHLGIDAAEWLDDFETGDALANLEAYEYLKDHDERVDAAPLALKRQKPTKQKSRPAPAARSAHSAALQPLLVFTASAIIITGAVFGFMKLSDQLADDAPTAANEEEEALAPVGGLLEGRPEPIDLSGASAAIPVTSDNLVAGDPTGSLGSETLNTSPSPSPPTEVAPEFSFESSPPPRAVIVEE